MDKSKYYNVEERRVEKHLSRELDKAALADGYKTVEQLRKENGLFYGIKVKLIINPVTKV